MSDPTLSQTIEAQRICFPQMPLAVYRELAAHLRQVNGVEAELLPQTSQSFDYQQSQVGGLILRYSAASPDAPQRLEQILAYYGQRHGGYSIAQSNAELTAEPN